MFKSDVFFRLCVNMHAHVCVCAGVCVCVCVGSQWGLYFGQSSLTDNSPPCSSHLLLRGREIDRL